MKSKKYHQMRNLGAIDGANKSELLEKGKNLIPRLDRGIRSYQLKRCLDFVIPIVTPTRNT